MERFRRDLSIGPLIVLIVSSVAWAQATAALNGRVTDESGAVLPGVTVTVTQTDTGSTRTVVTDTAGAYVMPNLPTGPYRLEVSLQGFRTYVQTGIVLQVGATPTINAVLAVGNLEETVSVEAAAPLVDVRSAGISEVVEQERIVELPLQGRQVTDLIVLAGAAVEDRKIAAGMAFPGGTRTSVAGSLTYGVAFALDGAMHNDPWSGANLPFPFPDALQEFSVATSGLSAQNGMHSGASMSAVTKSGTNRYSGNLFEFLRDKRFNATQVFAAIGSDGRRKDDGLRRNQFGGTLGGPIVQDKLFFFGGYQGTVTRQTPVNRIAYVPTAAMLAGDFTAFASAACQGRDVTLRAPFVNNRINPAMFSPAAVNLANRLPRTTNPCGDVVWGIAADADEDQSVGRIDYQWTANHTVFGRYIASSFLHPSTFAKQPDNILTTWDIDNDNLAQTLTVGDTVVIGANTVNTVRLAFNRTSLRTENPEFFEPRDLGINAYSYNPRQITLSVVGGFTISQGAATRGAFDVNSYQLADDLTLVRGRHQIGVGGNLAYWKADTFLAARSAGQWDFDAHATGLSLADFLMGRLRSVEQGGPSVLPLDQRYVGVYAQDVWRATDRVTINTGIRWEPFFGQNMRNGALANFSLDKFRRGVRSSVFHNAPAGFLYYGDADFPSGGRTAQHTQWRNMSPRVGVAWDVTGDGRTAVRSSYGLGYDYVPADYQWIFASSPPFGNRSNIEDPPGLFDDPYRHLGGSPHPLVTHPDIVYPFFGSFGTVDPDINSPRSQQWNVTYEQQLGSAWAADVSYLGSYYDRLWGQVALNPGVYLGLGSCTINGVSYAVCSTNSNLNNRRRLSLENPKEGQFIGHLDEVADLGTQRYHGLKLSVRRRSASGMNLSGNYTWSDCFGNGTPVGFSQYGSGYVNPDDPASDRGHCVQVRTHVANVTVGAQTPRFVNPVLRALASDWRASGVLNASSGAWLNITTGLDTAFSGIRDQRPNKVSENMYGAKTLTDYLNRGAYAQPANGTIGNLPRNAVEGPGFWTINLALSRLISVGDRHSLELRVETFNLTNKFNWGNPGTNLSAGTFGRVTSQAGEPRVLQFGIKYGF